MNVILYTSHCPRCRILEKKLQDKGIKFEMRDDIDEMISKGFKEAPKLEVDSVVMDFKMANEWIKGQ